MTILQVVAVDNPKAIVILLGWYGCSLRHLQKYSNELYQPSSSSSSSSSNDDNRKDGGSDSCSDSNVDCTTILAIASPMAIMLGTSSELRKIATQILHETSRIVQTTQNEREQQQERRSRRSSSSSNTVSPNETTTMTTTTTTTTTSSITNIVPIIVHVFSHGGTVVLEYVERILIEYQQQQQYQLQVQQVLQEGGDGDIQLQSQSYDDESSSSLLLSHDEVGITTDEFVYNTWKRHHYEFNSGGWQIYDSSPCYMSVTAGIGAIQNATSNNIILQCIVILIFLSYVCIQYSITVVFQRLRLRLNLRRLLGTTKIDDSHEEDDDEEDEYYPPIKFWNQLLKNHNKLRCYNQYYLYCPTDKLCDVNKLKELIETKRQRQNKRRSKINTDNDNTDTDDTDDDDDSSELNIRQHVFPNDSNHVQHYRYYPKKYRHIIQNEILLLRKVKEK